RGPGPHVLPPGKMQNGTVIREPEPARRRHAVDADFRFGGVKPPGWMMNLHSVRHSSVAAVIQAVALGEKVIERTSRWALGGTKRRIGSKKSGIAVPCP